MTTIVELEFCIRSTQTVIKRAEATLERLNAELTELKAQAQEQQEPEQESLLGRWATHPTYGRGIITDVEPSADGDVEFAFPDAGDCETRTSSIQVTLDEIDLDPATLNTEQDFEDAPEGTIAEELEYEQTVFMKHGSHWFPIGDDTEIESGDMAPCRVIRWGNDQ